jgi:hypothetical protein
MRDQPLAALQHQPEQVLPIGRTANLAATSEIWYRLLESQHSQAGGMPRVVVVCRNSRDP